MSPARLTEMGFAIFLSQRLRAGTPALTSYLFVLHQQIVCPARENDSRLAVLGVGAAT